MKVVMNFRKKITVLITSLLLSACVSTTDQEKRPLWIDNAQASYSITDYLTAVGQASKRDLATKNAKANLAEIFYVLVHAETKTLTEATKKESVLGVTMESSTSLQRNIQTETDQVIRGVFIKESWLSPSGEYYALALLEKRKAAIILTESIMELDQSSAEFIDYSINRAPNTIAALNALRSARDDQLTRAMANLKLKQISVSGIPADISSAKIEKLITEKLASMQISVVAPSSLSHAQTIQSGLAQLGVTVVPESTIQISADIDIADPISMNGWYWLRGSYELSISENGQVISRKRWPVKISAKQQGMLMWRLKDSINDKIENYLIELVSDSPTL